jgi:Zn-finger nucleic acid-binding protein
MMSERQGVEIDYCPQCRGVWLDRGELDKLLDRAAEQKASPAQPAKQYPEQRAQSSPYPPKEREHSYHDGKKHYKHKSWLSEIFD